MAHMFITGGTGFIGRRLCKLALKQGFSVSVLSRQTPQKVKQLCGAQVNVIASLSNLSSIPAIDYVVNLAGEPILNGRWTNKRKQLLRESRIELTRQLVNSLAKLNPKPSCIISGSAIGYYGETGDQICTETQPAGSDFAATLCLDWERAVQPATALKIRLCILRTGVVLGKGGGPLEKMLIPFKLGLGGRIGDGKQWLSWISLDDLCALIFYLINNADCKGIFNGTAPKPIRNADLTQQLADKLHRPARLPMPALALKIMLGEASGMLLGSQQIIPEAATQAGFTFQHPTLELALNAIM